ncbi:MAG: PilN domain-containing protein [Fibrobacter sp.]|nr:PilN domain-containing protein [Fibrobacter sp.]
MDSALGKAFNIATGRYWWVLCVQSVAEGGVTSSLYRVVRKKGAARSAVVASFSGSLEECRGFQIMNGGAADGVLLVDDATPVKILSETVGSTVDFPGYKPENFDRVESVVGAFSVVALKSAVETFARDVEGIGFKLLAHIPAALLYSELMRPDGDAPRLVSRLENGFAELWLFLEGNLAAYYKVVGDASAPLSCYVQERFVLGETPVEADAVNGENLARTAAEDAWLFKTYGMPAFHTPADKKAVSRIREAALFRRMLKVCAAFIFVSIFVIIAFGTATGVYAHRSEAQIQSFESKIQKQRELEQVWNQLESDRARSESYLRHRSRTASSLGVLASRVPENVWIAHWNVSKRIHSVQGYAASSEDVSSILAALENERKLVNVRLRTTEKTTWKGRPVVKFDLTAEDVR